MRATVSPRVRAAILEIARRPGFRENPCFYVHDLAVVDDRLRRLEVALPFAELFYAMKANPSAELLRHLRGARFVRGVEVASAGELDRALAAGFAAHEVIFTGPGKTAAELEHAVASGIARVHVESLVEAHRLNRVVLAAQAPPMEVLLRVNAVHELAGALNRAAGRSTKFGVDEAEVAAALTALDGLTGLRVRGLHVFAGSGVLDHRALLDFLRHALGLVRRLRDAGRELPVVDFGGGFGIDYRGVGEALDLAGLGAGLRGLVEELQLHDTRLLFELGRYVVGESGYYVAEIVDIKRSHGKLHIIAAGGINHQRRPMQYKVNHPTFIVPMERPPLFPGQPAVRDAIVDVDGPLCTAADVLATDLLVERAELGDLVVVGCSGAYGQSVAMVGFLSHPPAPEYFLGDGP
jgi:2-[(L-alanin-3-ylcarbamoyl)methyl]-2-hydroxybutanedioate decarboxylase